MNKPKTQKKQLKISHQTRKELIRLVTCEKLSVKFAHSKLGINYSTAKMIVRKYKQSGKITQFRRERANNYLESTSENYINDSSSENRQRLPKVEQVNPHYSQHISACQFQSFILPNQDYSQALDFFSMGSQYFSFPSIFYTYTAPNYFSM